MIEHQGQEAFATQPNPGRPPRSFFARLLRGMIRYVLPIVIVATAGLGGWHIYKTRPRAKPVRPAHGATLVEVAKLSRSTEQAVVSAMGTVIAAREIVLQPRVSGEIVELAPQFIPGGQFQAGEVILRIDSADYELALERARGDVARARYDLKMELGAQEIAQREWELLDAAREASDLDRELALRGPHLDKTNAALAAAMAAQQLAELDLKRTTIRAPYNGIITTKQVDLGAQVSPQTQIGRFVGTDEYWVQASIPVDRLDWIRFPADGGKPGSPVVVRQAGGLGSHSQWTGQVIRLLGDLEMEGRMARVLVSVKDPLGLTSPGEQKLPLLIGSYVHTDIEGRVLEGVFSIPRTALRDGDRVWLMDKDNALETRDIDIVWRDRKAVFVSGGIDEGERLIVSDIAAPIQGMALRTESPTDALAQASQPAPGTDNTP